MFCFKNINAKIMMQKLLLITACCLLLFALSACAGHQGASLAQAQGLWKFSLPATLKINQEMAAAFPKNNEALEHLGLGMHHNVTVNIDIERGMATLINFNDKQVKPFNDISQPGGSLTLNVPHANTFLIVEGDMLHMHDPNLGIMVFVRPRE